MNEYWHSVERFSRMNNELGCLVAKSGNMIKGYGNVRRRTLDSFNRFLDNIIFPLSDFEKKSFGSLKLTIDTGEKSLKLISDSTDGIEKAEELANHILKKKAA